MSTPTLYPVASHALAYAPSTRKLPWRKWLTAFVLVAIVGYTILVAIPKAQRFISAVGRGRTALSETEKFVLPPTTLVYDEWVPRESAAFYPAGWKSGDPPPLLRASRAEPLSNNSKTGGLWYCTTPMPKCYNDMWEAWIDAYPSRANQVKCASGLRPTKPVISVYGSSARSYGGCHFLLLLHGHQTPAGKRRLIELYFDAPAFLFDQPKPFHTTVSAVRFNGTLDVRSQVRSQIPCLNFSPPPDQLIRLYAGQPDPLNASRFTIPITIGTTPGTIHGQLNDDDSITLTLK